jgi:subtilase family serine protease
MKWQALLMLGSMAVLPVAVRPQATSLVTHSIDEARLVTLHGSVHPLAQARYDRGVVSDSFAADRVLLLLDRLPERGAALAQFLRDAHSPGSTNYHKWLTPDQFGEQFGPMSADLQVVSRWLNSHGFRVSRTSRSRQFIEFSGTAGQIREAFHTEIHQYAINGEAHYGNASDVKIPEALASLVRGVAPMNSFRAQPQVRIAGPALYRRTSKKATPQWTAPNQYGTANPYQFIVTPEDLATQYNLAPLYRAGVNGTGQTIGIINESNIDLSLVQAYQKLFGVGGITPQVVIDGDDPGTISGVDVEAYLDVELAGAVAPKSTVSLYIANASNLQDPLELAALRAVEDNQASVLSVSFGQCELYLGNAGNGFWSALWEQAAAQGQTVLVSSGDTGSVCNNTMPNVSVNGLASTPWNLAVGGTDFYYSDYASGGASADTLWNSANDASLGSLKAPLPEQPWNDSLGLNVIADGFERGEYGAGGGGASSCSTQDASTHACMSGYAKPGWQNVSGVPADGVRDLPDVSLFASNGANLSAYAICGYEGECATQGGGNTEVLLVGGTSASSPAMAGIMALVNQKYGRQGQANFTLYALAQQRPAAFHDITVGSNSFPCVVGGNETCVQMANGHIGTAQYPAGIGYDQASGLGSVDASQFVDNWNSIAFQPTTTTLHLSSSSVVHGTPVTLTTSVVPSSGSGTPTGDVAILTSSTLPASQSQLSIHLSSGNGSSSVNYLPGGEYQVTARYGGDGTFAASTSTPETLTVTPERSNINFSMVNGSTAITNGGSVQYNAPLALVIQPTGISAGTGKTNGNATGTATFTIDSTTATVALNGSGVATWTLPALGIGTHNASASYSGDSSFAAASSTPVAFSVTKGQVTLDGNFIGPYTILPNTPGISISPGSSLTISAVVQGANIVGVSPSQIPLGTAAPSGTVRICLTQSANLGAGACYSPVYSQTVRLSTLSGTGALKTLGVATFPHIDIGQYGMYFASIQYSGDSVWAPAGLIYSSPINVQTLPTYANSATALSITPTSFSGLQTAKVTATVTGSGNSSTSPRGEIDFYNNNVFLTSCVWRAVVPGQTSTCSFGVTPNSFLNSGANQLIAVYQGDGANGPSVSNVVDFTATQTASGDFTLAPQAPQITVRAGSSGSIGLNLTSLSGFAGAVTLTCTPSSSQFSCNLNPTTVALNGAATATVTINATAQTAGLMLPIRQGSARWPLATGILAFGLFVACRRTRRTFERGMMLVLCTFLFMFVSCGGGAESKTITPAPTPAPGMTPSGTYSVVISGTANGIVHNAKLTMIVL